MMIFLWNNIYVITNVRAKTYKEFNFTGAVKFNVNSTTACAELSSRAQKGAIAHTERHALHELLLFHAHVSRSGKNPARRRSPKGDGVLMRLVTLMDNLLIIFSTSCSIETESIVIHLHS